MSLTKPADPFDHAQDLERRYLDDCVRAVTSRTPTRDYVIFWVQEGESRECRHHGSTSSLFTLLESPTQEGGLGFNLETTPWAAGFFDAETKTWVVDCHSTNGALTEQIRTRPHPAS